MEISLKDIVVISSESELEEKYKSLDSKLFYIDKLHKKLYNLSTYDYDLQGLKKLMKGFSKFYAMCAITGEAANRYELDFVGDINLVTGEMK